MNTIIGNADGTLSPEQWQQAIANLAQFDPKENAIIAQTVIAARDLVIQNWSQIKDVRERNDNTVNISLGFAVNCNGQKAHVKTTLAFSRKFKDEREDWVEPTPSMFEGKDQ